MPGSLPSRKGSQVLNRGQASAGKGAVDCKAALDPLHNSSNSDRKAYGRKPRWHNKCRHRAYNGLGKATQEISAQCTGVCR